MPILTNQCIPESQKTESWCQKQVNSIVMAARGSSESKVKDVVCWRLFNENQDERDFDYLRKYGEYEVPAFVRHIGIQRPNINLLHSKQSRRAFVFSVYLADNASIEEKYKAKIKNYLDIVLSKMKMSVVEKQNSLNAIKKQSEQIAQGIQQAEQQLQQAQQQGQQIPPDAFQNIEMAKMKKDELDNQMSVITDKISNDIYLTSDEIKDLDKYYRYTYKDIKEEIAQKYLVYARNKLHMQDEALKAFLDNLVTGKSAYFVDYEGEQMPTFRQENFLKIYYPVEDNVRYLQNSTWVAIEEMLSITQILDMWGDVLNKEQIDKIESSRNWYVTSTMISLPSGGAVFNDNSIYSGTGTSFGSMRVFRVFWQSTRKVHAKTSPNKYMEGENHIHFLTPQEEDRLAKKEFRLRDEEKLHTRYVNDLYEGVLIGNDIFVNCRKHRFPLRKEDKPSYTELPVVGKTHNNLTERPYSLIWATKDIQKLYNIVHFHREVMLALSGVKTFVMDISQIPDNMSPQEWEYQKKMGTINIQTVKKGVRTNSNFNQFTALDLSVGPSIQYIDNILQGLVQMNDMIMGVTPQTKGQMGQYDLVETSKMSISQSSLITEIKFYEQDEVERLALERFMNLSAKYCLKKNMLFQFMNSDFGMEMIKLHEDLDECDFEIFMLNNMKEDQKLQEIKQLVGQEYTKNILPLHNILPLFSLESATEMQHKLEQISEEQEKIRSNMAQGGAQMERANKEALIKLQGEVDAQIKQSELQLQQAQLETERAKIQMAMQIEQQKIEIERQKLAQQEKLGILGISSERDIEGQYLYSQDRHATIDQQLKAVELQNNIALDTRQQKIDHVNNEKTHIIDEKAMKQKNKEKIK